MITPIGIAAAHQAKKGSSLFSVLGLDPFGSDFFRTDKWYRLSKSTTSRKRTSKWNYSEAT